MHAERQLIAALNEQMGWNDVELFFKRLRIPRPDFGGESHTFTDLTRGYLRDCSDDVLLEIAHQLGLDIPSEERNDDFIALGDSKYWLIDHFRVFISHFHTAKLQAGALRNALQRYAISAFVAHDDIETSDEWREEILRSLMSMDAFVAILTPDFNSSKWTDQEVGIAVARDVLQIPINRGENPYGFLSKYQALVSKGLVVKDVAAEIFRTICTNVRTKGRMIESLTRTISTGSDALKFCFVLRG
ncbi:MAG: toll/interleukin-1 receptor domain-containing protein [Bradyrhizobium sp.]